MLNYIWAFMIMVGVIYGSVTGNIKEVSNAALDSAGEAEIGRASCRERVFGLV